jgi:hypothetical protein
MRFDLWRALLASGGDSIFCAHGARGLISFFEK